MYIITPQEKWECEKAMLLVRYLLPPGAIVDCDDPNKLTVKEVMNKVAEIKAAKGR